jgi:hypothetical protein
MFLLCRWRKVSARAGFRVGCGVRGRRAGLHGVADHEIGGAHVAELTADARWKEPLPAGQLQAMRCSGLGGVYGSSQSRAPEAQRPHLPVEDRALQAATPSGPDPHAIIQSSLMSHDRDRARVSVRASHAPLVPLKQVRAGGTFAYLGAHRAQNVPKNRQTRTRPAAGGEFDTPQRKSAVAGDRNALQRTQRCFISIT